MDYIYDYSDTDSDSDSDLNDISDNNVIIPEISHIVIPNITINDETIQIMTQNS